MLSNQFVPVFVPLLPPSFPPKKIMNFFFHVNGTMCSINVAGVFYSFSTLIGQVLHLANLVCDRLVHFFMCVLRVFLVGWGVLGVSQTFSVRRGGGGG